MGSRPVVLVAARQRAVRRLVLSALRPAGFIVAECDWPSPSVSQVADIRPDIIVMEAEAPPTETFRAIRELAARERLPILLMSPTATPRSVSVGLDAGADDYIARPFDSAELAARVRSLLRRKGRRIHRGQRRIGDVYVDLESRVVAVGGSPVRLSRHEWNVLSLLVANPGRVMLREELLAASFGDAARDDVGALRTTIARIRRKLGIPSWQEGFIRTVHGLGYVLDEAQDVPPAWSPRRPVPRLADDPPAAGLAGTE